MNYLAHIALSKKYIDYQVGNVLADPCKGKIWQGASSQHRQGLALHKKIDRFTDTHLVVKEAKSLIKKGYLRAIVIDIFFDHCIYLYWRNFFRIDFEQFTHIFYQNARQHARILPIKQRQFIQKIVRHDVLSLYKNLSSLHRVFIQFDKRLSKKLRSKETTASYIDSLHTHYHSLQKLFIIFFPDLIQYVLQQNNAQIGEHYFVVNNT